MLVHERGYTNHLSDPGEPTNFGITNYDCRKYVKPDATTADVRTISVDQAKAIYRTRYWDAHRRQGRLHLNAVEQTDRSPGCRRLEEDARMNET